MKPIAVKNCICCGSSFFSTYWLNENLKSISDSKQFMYGGCRFIKKLDKCANCGFIFQNPIIESNGYYEDSSNDSYLELEKFRLEYFLKVKKKLSKFFTVQQNMSILDLGAGAGDWLKCFPDTKKYATEVNPELIKILTRNEITIVDLNTKNSTKKYDLITAFDFIEHVINPSEMLAQLVENGKFGGYMVIGVPDMGKIISRILKQKYYLYTPMHYSYFNKKSLFEFTNRFLDEVVVIKSPPMRSNFAGVAKWLGIGGVKLFENLTFPLGYKASIIAIGKFRIEK